MRSSSSTTLSRFAVQSPIGDLIEPLTRLAVHIVEVKEIAQRPEVLPYVTDTTTFHFSLLPATRLIAGAWVKVDLTGKGQEARIEADQAPIMFGDGGGQVVIPDLPGDAVQLLKRVDVTTNKGLETLAVLALQILHAAVPGNEGERVELPLIALVIERFEVPPVGLEAFARLWFHTHEGSLRLQLRAYFVHVLAQNAAATVVAQWAEPLPDHGGAGGRILFEQLGDGGFIRRSEE